MTMGRDAEGSQTGGMVDWGKVISMGIWVGG